MKFATKEDIEAPIDHVFQMLSDFENFERSALRRGAEIERLDSLAAPAAGAAWNIRFLMRGKERQLKLDLVEYVPSTEMVFKATSPGMNGTMHIDLVALSRQRTRMNMVAEITPQTLTARLFVQSLKLARANLSKRLDTRMASMARDMEERYARLA